MGNALQTIFGPIGTIFNAIFYEPIYNILMLIYNLIHSIGVPGALGLSIIALTLLVRCAMIPLTRKQLKSSRAMQELAPQINALKVQYRGDPQGLMKAQQDLYKEHGYSPVSGCLPLLIQMPFLYALLFSFRTLLTVSPHPKVILDAINKPIYPFLPQLTAIPNPHFLWVNLVQADPLHILPFLAAFFTLVQLRMAMPVRKKPAPGTPSDPTSQATQTTMYIMPVITFIFALSFPSGLALYWTVGAMFASVQQYFLAGWGSLFLGIPGFEHLVPPPKELPGTAPASGGTGVARAGARSLVASSPSRSSSTVSSEPERSGGLRGFFRQMREMADQQAQSQEAARAGKGPTSTGRNVVDTVPASDRQLDNTVNGAKKTDTGVGGTGSGTNQATRRNRAAARPTLVKPATNADLPEKAIQREATAPLDDSATNSEKGSNPLPEVAISRAAKSNGRGTSGSPSSSPSTTGSRPALSTRNTSSTNNGSGSRRSNGSNGKGSSSSSSSRNRSTNRSKGGR